MLRCQCERAVVSDGRWAWRECTLKTNLLLLFIVVVWCGGVSVNVLWFQTAGGPDVKWVEGGRPLFRVRLHLVSTVYTQVRPSLSLYRLVLEWEWPQAVSLFVPLGVGVRMTPGSLSLCTAWCWSENGPRQSLSLYSTSFTTSSGGVDVPCVYSRARWELPVTRTQTSSTTSSGGVYIPCVYSHARWEFPVTQTQAPQHPQVEFMYLVFTRVPGESYLSHKHNTSSTTSSGGVDVHCIYLHARWELL